MVAFEQYEILFGTDRSKEDMDEDGLSDYIEIYKSETDPLIKDSDGNGIEDGKADIVFVIDSTGSMSGAINNVVKNIDHFVDTLLSVHSVKANFALIDYKDITCGEKTTLIKNGSSNWFNDAKPYGRKPTYARTNKVYF